MIALDILDLLTLAGDVLPPRDPNDDDDDKDDEANDDREPAVIREPDDDE